MFTGEAALGNPCAVVELDTWLVDTQLLKVTRELGQPVTSFVLEDGGQFHIRWFSQHSEINLCGHGSLGAGAVILAKNNLMTVTFRSRHGDVEISKQGDSYGITLPAWQGKVCELPDFMSGIAEQAVEVFATRDLVMVLPNEEAVREFQPDHQNLAIMDDYHALIVTAQSGCSEYVLRYFAPKIGINEDIATGSAQCSLAPYWFAKSGETVLTARQLSASGGYFTLQQISASLIKVFAKVKPSQQGAPRRHKVSDH